MDVKKNQIGSIPDEVMTTGRDLIAAGFKAYIVGGCVRDLVMGREPKDWDIATDARPEEIQKLFPESVYENAFGTVGVKTHSEDPKLKVIEITTFRLEGKYTDKRHPDRVRFAKTIEEDLARRDFTVNALALVLESKKMELVDPFRGMEDLENKVLRTVGNPRERFNEDALRLMRAVRFATELSDFSARGARSSSLRLSDVRPEDSVPRESNDLTGQQGPASGWEIEFETRRAIEREAGLLEMIAKERIRDELIKIVMSEQAARGIILLEELDLLRYVLPELREGLGVGQNKHHIYTVFEHNVRALDYTAKQNYSLLVRLASLLHDVGKPRVKAGDGPDSTFYNHEVVGAKMTLKILDRLRFPKDFTEKVAHLVRYHLFYYNVGEVTPAGVRRFLGRVGPENVDDLMKVREADRIGSGVPKAVPYKLRHLLFMIEKVKHDPLSPKMLKVNGEDVKRILGIPPGPRVGHILAILLEEILENPEMNSRAELEEQVYKLGSLKESELKRLSDKAKEKKEEFESGIEEEMKKKHRVK